MSRTYPKRSYHDAAVHVLLAGVFADWHARGDAFSALPGAPVVDDRPTQRKVPGPVRRLVSGASTGVRNRLARADRPAAPRLPAADPRAAACACSPAGSAAPTGV
jgi:hypothetical protein